MVVAVRRRMGVASSRDREQRGGDRGGRHKGEQIRHRSRCRTRGRRRRLVGGTRVAVEAQDNEEGDEEAEIVERKTKR